MRRESEAGSSGTPAAMSEARELAEAVEELNAQLVRFQENLQKVTEFQVSLLRVNKLMCFWMENTHKLIKHRTLMFQTPPTLNQPRK